MSERHDEPVDLTGLTKRQRRILVFLKDHIEQRGYPPSMREVGAACDLASTSSVSHQLRMLERKGFIRRDPNLPRALEIYQIGRAHA